MHELCTRHSGIIVYYVCFPVIKHCLLLSSARLQRIHLQERYRIRQHLSYPLEYSLPHNSNSGEGVYNYVHGVATLMYVVQRS